MNHYAKRLRAAVATFERQERELGRPYALQELRGVLNALSNEALQELQRMREETPI